MTSEQQRLVIHLTPKASKNAIIGWTKNAHGDDVLKACVTAIADKGKANKALIALLAKEWKIPKSSIIIVRGKTERIKTIEIPAEHRKKLGR